jgi:hypothetical protein
LHRKFANGHGPAYTAATLARSGAYENVSTTHCNGAACVTTYGNVADTSRVKYQGGGTDGNVGGTGSVATEGLNADADVITDRCYAAKREGANRNVSATARD